ncbi:Os11g0202450 [Oryza sativa Japonica Group]|uniref:Os11g0202450 protein n=1 Tax=Oryza sativa subsp. japonica TaxID=39947 RepID=A0A0P0Y036_ORYSJ|nr:Os11g0202450 [Oryza sativa Japonica Group]
MQLSALKSSGTHQYSLSNKVFSLVNVGHHFKSLFKINCAECKKEDKQKPQSSSGYKHININNEIIQTTQRWKCKHTDPCSLISPNVLASDKPSKSTQLTLTNASSSDGIVSSTGVLPWK